MALHCLETKVSSEDLHNDHKYTEHSDFADYTWIVISNDPKIREQAMTDVPSQTGIIVADPKADKLSVLRVAKYIRESFRESGLMTALLRSI